MSTTRSATLLELLQTKVMGSVEIPSQGGDRYFITFIDDLSKWTTVYILRKNSES